MIYFDHAATGLPKSESVINAVACAMRYCGNPGRGINEASMAGDRALYNCRNELSKTFNALPENCILTKNTTEALNYAIKGFIDSQKDGFSVLISGFEHNAVTRILKCSKYKNKIKVFTFNADLFDDRKTIENFKNAITPDVKLAILTHASNVCGRIFPIKELVVAAKNASVTVITDAAQTAGITEVASGSYGDIICLPGHKCLYGPSGTGAMIIHQDYRGTLMPLLHGGTGVLSTNVNMPDFYPERFEAGTMNAPAYAGLCQALKEKKRYDKKPVSKIFKFLLNELNRIKGITVIGAPESGCESLWAPIILFNVWGRGSYEVAESLSNEGFALRGGLHCAPSAHKALGTLKTGGIRLSIGRGNTVKQAEALIDAITRKVSG